ncbi:MAG: hypothetical protein RLZZ352_2844 [Pseudomonadota bacterium]|jgi:type II secretory ATPase GspE/PulE/Tfp pilus assembly ATPase PilB-like protein/GAF domain-containing protein
MLKKTTVQEFADAQAPAPGQAPPPVLHLSNEAVYYRNLQHVTARIHDTDNLDELMLEVSADICRLLSADRLTLYLLSDDGQSIVSRIKTGLGTTKDLRLPVSTQSLAGFVAVTQRFLAIRDVYDDAELKSIDLRLTYLKAVDQRTGYRTREMMVAPIQDSSEQAGRLLGVLQIMNHTQGRPFGELEVDVVRQLCSTLAAAIRRRQQTSAVPVPPVRRSKYDRLVADGLLSAAELHSAMVESREQDASLERLLQTRFKLRPAQIGHSLQHFFGAPYVGFEASRLRIEALHGRLKKDFILAHRWLALEETPQGLLIMCIDPEGVRSGRTVPHVFHQHSQFVYAVTTEHDFELSLAQLYGKTEATVGDMLAGMNASDAPEADEDEALSAQASDNELVKFVNKVIVDAYQQGASDIHIEPLPGKLKTGIRFRIDGSLTPYVEVPASFRQSMVTRLKIMCDLDISERRKPQDGKIQFRRFGPLDIELRVATIPSAGGVEDVVMRILAAGEPIALEQLGLTPHNHQRLVQTVAKPYGLFYVCGPTGSGKTTTLHSILKHQNTPETKIWTAEDPVEITQRGLRQVQVNRKAGIDFALVMRAFLRADPDIIMVGESRDQETVRMGIEASLTGHLVFSTLHTNSAPESVTRLLDMGVDPYNFADALLGILAQRLAKRLCACKQAYTPDAQELEDFVREYSADLQHTPAWREQPEQARARLLARWQQQHGQSGQLRLYRARGCDACRGTGYKGRVGLHELLVADDTVRRLVQTRARVTELFAACLEAGMHSLKMDGMEKVLMGLTDLKQVRSVCIK